MLKHLRLVCNLIFMLLCSVSYTQASCGGGVRSGTKIVSAVDVDEKIGGKLARATTIELTIMPGETSEPHKHPGPVYGYVLEGVFKFKVEGQPVQILKVGDSFYEPMMALHEVAENPTEDQVTKVLAIVVHPRDAESLVIMDDKF